MVKKCSEGCQCAACRSDAKNAKTAQKFIELGKARPPVRGSNSPPQPKKSSAE